MKDNISKKYVPSGQKYEMETFIFKTGYQLI